MDDMGDAVEGFCASIICFSELEGSDFRKMVMSGQWIIWRTGSNR